MWSVVPEFWGEAPYPTLTGIGVTWLYQFEGPSRLRGCRTKRRLMVEF